uniref:PH domain-containing protein n=1 Tax=Monodelphis domestica TaxID=13616 RepID=A0A5F8H0M4_MONDO
MAFVESGWLLRQSTILKRWEKNWFDLWSDGHLVYYYDGKTINLCAESADDCLAWQFTAVASSPPPYTAYATPSPEAYAVPYQYPYPGPYGQQPANHVIIRECYRDNDGDLALGMLAGAATGVALGSLFWSGCWHWQAMPDKAI